MQSNGKKEVVAQVKPVQQILIKKVPVEYHGVQSNSFNDETTWVPIYRMPYIIVFRSVIRFKVYLTFMSMAACMTRFGQLFMDNQTPGLAGMAILSTLTLGGLVLVGDYSRKLICQIYSTDDMEFVRLCRFTFFGKRKDVVLPISCVIPLTETNASSTDPILDLKFMRPDKLDLKHDAYEFYDEHMRIALRMGGVLDKQKFIKIFGKVV